MPKDRILLTFKLMMARRRWLRGVDIGALEAPLLLDGMYLCLSARPFELYHRGFNSHLGFTFDHIQLWATARGRESYNWETYSSKTCEIRILLGGVDA